MKKITIILFLLLLQIANAQNQNSVKSSEDALKVNDTLQEEKSFWDDIEIAESMETSDQRGDPAQIQFTFPKDKSESYLINLGLAYRLPSAGNLISKIKTEFHKNSLLEKEQENFEIGYQGQLGFRFIEGTGFLIFDPKYVYDGVNNKSSVASNISFTFKNYESPSPFKFNTNNYYLSERINFIPSLYVGFQLQNSFKAKLEENEGFIMRPYFSGSFSFYLNKKDKPTEGILKLTALYTGRKDAINNTDVDEGYTGLLKTGVEVFLINAPIRISIGASFNKGSDPMKGLAKQEYWLLSLNVLRN